MSKVDPETPWIETTSGTSAQTIDPATLTSVTFLPLDGSPLKESRTPTAHLEPIATTFEATSVLSGTAMAEPPTIADRWLLRTLSGIALAWFSLSLIYLVWQSLRFRWQMRHVTLAEPSHRRLLESICECRGIRRRVRLLQSDRFDEPVAYGLLRWTILIPAKVEKRLNHDELAALLTHELAHLIRGDIVWLVIGRVLTASFAFQPLNFLARRRWQEHAEFQCDDWAVDRNVDRLTLARSLTLVAEWRAGRKSCAGVVSAVGARFHVSDRVERLVADAVPDLWRRRSRRFAIHLAALLAAAAVVVFGPQTGGAERTGASEDTTTEIQTDDPKTNSEADARTEDESTDHDGADPALSRQELSELIREVDGFAGDVSGLLDDLHTMEPVLARLEQQPELVDRVAQLRTRIGLLRKLADARSFRETAAVDVGSD